MKQKIALGLMVTGCALTGLCFSSKASALDETLSAEQEAIRATAYAFYDRGAALQYDNSTLTYQGRGRINFGPPAVFTPGGVTRGQYFYNPEIATEDDRQYTVCSSFVYQALYNTFSKNGEGYKINYPLIGRENEVGFDTTAKFFTDIGNPHTTYYSANLNDQTIFSEDLTVFYIDKDTYYKKDNNGDVTLCDRDHTSDCPEYFEFDVNPTIKDGSYNSAKVAALRADLDSVIQPGDVVSYYLDNDAGHTVLYVGNNEVLESRSANPNGSVYAFNILADRFEDEGTINLIPKDPEAGVKTLWSSSRALQSRAIKITILRPLNEISKQNYTISTDASTRTDYFRLVPTKTASVNRYGSVDLGGTVTYTVSLENKSGTNYTGITLKDSLPTSVLLKSVSSDACSISGQNLNCANLSVNAGGKISITYEVEVPDTFTGRYFETPNTTVNDIPLTNIITYVGDTVDDDDMDEFNALLENQADGTFDDSIAYINAVYDGTGIGFDDADTIIDKLMDVDGVVAENERGYILRTILNRLNSIGSTFEVLKLNPSDDYYSKMYMHGRFGGTMTISDQNGVDAKRRARYLETPDFTPGDVLIVNDGNDMNDAFLYIGDGKFNHVNNGAVETITGTDTTVLLESLIGRENFVVLRPSLVLTETIPDEEEKGPEEEESPSVPDTGVAGIFGKLGIDADYMFVLYATIIVCSATVLIKRLKKSR